MSMWREMAGIFLSQLITLSAAYECRSINVGAGYAGIKRSALTTGRKETKGE
jgi:hypothetical protein